jgi:hypothetical protein
MTPRTPSGPAVAAGLAVAAGMAALAVGMGSGVATADALVGKSFGDASGTIATWGGTAVVSTVVGDRQNRDDCTVASWRKDPQNHGKYLVALNCAAAVAAPGVSGNSVASPEGRAAAQQQANIKWRSQNPQWCADAMTAHPEWGELEGCVYG